MSKLGLTRVHFGQILNFVSILEYKTLSHGRAVQKVEALPRVAFSHARFNLYPASNRVVNPWLTHG